MVEAINMRMNTLNFQEDNLELGEHLFVTQNEK
jgi:hypothetical protein